MELVLKVNNKKCFSGQRKHTVQVDGRHLGTVYDNRECDSQRDTYAFLPQTARVAGKFLCYTDRRDRLQHPELRSNELGNLLSQIREWAEEVDAYVAGERAKLADVLAKIEQPEYKVYAEKFSNEPIDGMRCQVIGPEGSFIAELSWADMAKLIATSHDESFGYQITDAGLRGKDYGFKWQYIRGTDTIRWNSYSGNTVMEMKRSERHAAYDKERAA